jgi:hypothetical protein
VVGRGDNGDRSSVLEVIQVGVIFARTVGCVGHDFLRVVGMIERGKRAAGGVSCAIEMDAIYIPYLLLSLAERPVHVVT